MPGCLIFFGAQIYWATISMFKATCELEQPTFLSRGTNMLHNVCHDKQIFIQCVTQRKSDRNYNQTDVWP